MLRVFISYRRDDSSGYAGRLYDALRDRFGAGQVFIDVDAIEPGADFVEVIERAVGTWDVVLALIGPRWLTAADARRRRRLNDQNDFVRLELATALERGARVIPVLVGGAAMPRTDELPEPLRVLARRHAVEITDARWQYDVGRLIQALERMPGGTREGPPGEAASDAPSPPDDSSLGNAVGSASIEVEQDEIDAGHVAAVGAPAGSIEDAPQTPIDDLPTVDLTIVESPSEDADGAAPTELAPDALLGPYRLVERAGAGGMAEVWRAHHPGLDLDVAIKVLARRYSDEPDYLARFRREARAVARLDHPSILRVQDFGELDGLAYMVSPFVSGGTLADWMGTPWTLSEALRVLRPLASALDYAHTQGIVHRDVKPSNVLLDEGGKVLLGDFGVARVLDGAAVFDTSGRLTVQAALIGTPQYMAPEQVRGEPAGPAADLYALDVVAYELLTGRVPFRAETWPAVLAAHLHEPPPPPRSVNPDLSEATEAVLLKGLAKSPKERYASASELVAALEAAAPARSTPPPPTPRPEPPPRPVPPGPGPRLLPRAMSGATGVLAAIGLLVVVLILVLVAVQVPGLSTRGALRQGAAVAPLPDGKLLLIGGTLDYGNYNKDTVLRYEPDGNTWSSAPSMAAGRTRHTATALNDGRILVVGGYDGRGHDYVSAERYDPVANAWTRVAPMSLGREDHTATLLADGSVLVFGPVEGPGDRGLLGERYDPAADRWTLTEPAAHRRSMHTATLLPGGEVLVVGGDPITPPDPAAPRSAERYSPATNRWTEAAPPSLPRSGHTATLLPNGEVLVAGGVSLSESGVSIADPRLLVAELYNPANNTWRQAASASLPRRGGTAIRLTDGRVLVFGGGQSKAERYDPAANAWTEAGAVECTPTRGSCTATLLRNGRVLVTGQDASQVWRYDPASNTWTAAAPLPGDLWTGLGWKLDRLRNGDRG